MQNIVAPIQIWKEGKVFVGYIPRLEITSCGKTIAEARKNTLETLEIFIEETRKKGTFAELMEEAGFGKSKNFWRPEIVKRGKLSLAI